MGRIDRHDVGVLQLGQLPRLIIQIGAPLSARLADPPDWVGLPKTPWRMLLRPVARSTQIQTSDRRDSAFARSPDRVVPRLWAPNYAETIAPRNGLTSVFRVFQRCRKPWFFQGFGSKRTLGFQANWKLQSRSGLDIRLDRPIPLPERAGDILRKPVSERPARCGIALATRRGKLSGVLVCLATSASRGRHRLTRPGYDQIADVSSLEENQQSPLCPLCATLARTRLSSNQVPPRA